MHDIPEGVLDNFKKPFITVEKLSLWRNRNEHQLAGDDWINKLFPKIKHLKLGGCSSLIYNQDILNHFPSLEHFEILHNNIRWDCKCREKIIAAMKMNPNLKKLNVVFCTLKNAEFDANFLQSVEESLQNLESISLILFIRQKFYTILISKQFD